MPDHPDKTTPEAEAFADAVLAQLELEFLSLPGEIREALETAALSGVQEGLLQLDLDTSSGSLLNSVNDVARSYALDRSAELIGMSLDTDGNLIANPDAQWVIADTTRSRIRDIIAEAFSEDTPLAEIKDEIREVLEAEAFDGGIFSEERAGMIARTEVAMAQACGNFEVWRQSGLVKKVRWLTSSLGPCDECAGNEDEERELGEEFPDGSVMPPAHPNCRCGLVVTETGRN